MPCSNKWRYKLMTAVIWIESILWTQTWVIIIHYLTFVITLLSGAAMHGSAPFPVLLSTSPAWVLLPGQTFMAHSVSMHCSPVLIWKRQGCCHMLSLFCNPEYGHRLLFVEFLCCRTSSHRKALETHISSFIGAIQNSSPFMGPSLIIVAAE